MNMHIYACVRVGAYVCVHTCKVQRSTSGLVPQVISTLYFETGSLLDLELTKEAALSLRWLDGRENRCVSASAD